MRKAFLGGAALTLFAAAGCADERAITTEPVGDPGYGQNLIRQITSLPRGSTGFPNAVVASANPANDSVWIDFAGLDSLETGYYTVWIGNDSATKFAKLTYNLRINSIDTVINAAGDPEFVPSTVTIPSVSSFRNGGPNRTFRLSTNRAATPGLAAGDSANVVLISVEDSPDATTPSGPRFLWARRNEATVTRNTQTGLPTTTISGLRFGNYQPRALDAYVYAVSATGAVPTISIANNVPRGRIEVRGPIFTVNDSNYYRPPVGFYYQAWTVRIDEFGRFVDTLSLGDKASPYPRRISFREADTSIPDPLSMYMGDLLPCAVTATNSTCIGREPVIFASQHRVNGDTIPDSKVDGGPWRGFAWTFVTLQNKKSPTPSARMGTTILMAVNHPGSISGL